MEFRNFVVVSCVFLHVFLVPSNIEYTLGEQRG
jgi:hypothetical protein